MNISFLDLFNASISASWLVLVVVVLRLALKKAPKSIHCLLWALVAFRLLCPISIESPVSLMPSTETISQDYLMEPNVHAQQQTVLDIVENPIYPENINVSIEAPISRINVRDIEWSLIWLMGVGVMAVYVLVSWLRLRRQVAASISIASHIRLCDHIESPFILGVFRPVIYLPSDLGQDALDHVLAHEMAHIARKDHWWKPLGFALLTIHWFNPIMWLAYILLCRDIELACDEKVIKNLDIGQKKAYSAALLGCSVSRPLIAACPLAFGEVGVKERVKTVLNYKKPGFWIKLFAAILCVIAAVCFLTDPPGTDTSAPTEPTDVTEPSVYPYNGAYKAGDLLAQHAMLSSGFGTGDLIFHLNEHTLSVYDLSGNELLYSTRVVISNPTREELFGAMENCMAVWKTGENGQIISEMKPDFIPDADEIALWQFHADNSQTHYPGYTLFFFDGELRWFAKNYNDSYERIYEVTIPMPEDTLLPEGSYVGQEKLYWAPYSSFYTYKMEMDVTDSDLVIRFNYGERSEVLPMNRSWQDECPISEKRRALLAELSNIDPILAIRDLSGCRYLVIDDTHFLIERKGELFLVAWQHSNIGLEILQYVYRVIPAAEYEDHTGEIILGTVTPEQDPLDAAILHQIRMNNPIEVNGVMTSAISFEPVQHIIGCGEDGSDNILYLKVRIGVYANDPQFRQVDALDFEAAIHIFTSPDAQPEVLAYWQSHTDSPDELDIYFTGFNQALIGTEVSTMELELECVRQAALNFGLDGDALTQQLKQAHPEYFNLAPTDKLEVMWSDTPDGIRCGITDGINYDLTNDLTSLEAYLILRQYPNAEVAFLEVKAGGASVPTELPPVFSNP